MNAETTAELMNRLGQQAKAASALMAKAAQAMIASMFSSSVSIGLPEAGKRYFLLFSFLE